MLNQERIENYAKEFPKYPRLSFDKDWITGTWVIGNFYKNASDYYGAYPHSYLKRIMSLFPDCKNILHLFSGSLKDVEGIKFDRREDLNPDVVGDAEKLSEYFTQKFNLILADPPYSEEDALHYGVSMCNRNKVVQECVKVLDNEGFLVWLDQVLPMYSSKQLKLIGAIGIVRSTNNRVRMAFIFQKVSIDSPCLSIPPHDKSRGIEEFL